MKKISLFGFFFEKIREKIFVNWINVEEVLTLFKEVYTIWFNFSCKFIWKTLCYLYYQSRFSRGLEDNKNFYEMLAD